MGLRTRQCDIPCNTELRMQMLQDGEGRTTRMQEMGVLSGNEHQAGQPNAIPLSRLPYHTEAVTEDS